MRKLQHALFCLTLIPSVCGQIFDDQNSAAVSNNSASFKPKYPVHCRPMDFDQWKAFGGAEGAASPEAKIRCQRLYGDPKLQPGAASGESLKLCEESYTAYGAWQSVPGDPGSRRLFCNVGTMNLDSQMVKMNLYLESKLVGNVLTIDHDIKRQFERWYDVTNLRLLDMWVLGELFGEVAPKVSDECANAYATYMCSNILPNCTYMPFARWPYHDLYEKIYTCKEVCETVEEKCDALWISHPLRCTDFVSKEVDFKIDPQGKMTPYERREAGGHACASVELTEKFVSGVASLTNFTFTSTFTCLVLIMTWHIWAV